METRIMESSGYRRKFYIESYGCQMNFADSEIVASILNDNGFGATGNYEEADLVLLNTCSIREKAEQTVRNRLQLFRQIKEHRPGMLIGVLGCMAERLKGKFLEEEQLVDIVVGPDAYRTLPGLIGEAETGQKAVNVLLSRRNLCRYLTRPARQQRRHRLREHHAGLQQYVLVLCGAFYPRPGTKP
jgi:tRNA-2-methylthio-N6-dimethylallyladenosine synthase